ncbi:MAG: hypothetical protein ACM3SU_04770 [Acidobacteriota bacterium]
MTSQRRRRPIAAAPIALALSAGTWLAAAVPQPQVRIPPADAGADALPARAAHFVSQLGGDESWKNLGHGRFRNITKQAGVGVPGRVGVTASLADIDRRPLGRQSTIARAIAINHIVAVAEPR